VWIEMRKLALVLIAAAVAAAPAGAAVRPLSGVTLLAIDRKAGFRNYLPTRMLSGFGYASWSQKGGVLRVDFRNKAGRTVVWTVAPMAGSCDSGKQKSFQLAGNKVWWAQAGGAQRAWRCVFGQDGKALRLSASSTTPPTQLADVGLGTVVASGKRY
jgi:hypothetical protein